MPSPIENIFKLFGLSLPTCNHSLRPGVKGMEMGLGEKGKVGRGEEQTERKAGERERGKEGRKGWRKRTNGLVLCDCLCGHTPKPLPLPLKFPFLTIHLPPRPALSESLHSLTSPCSSPLTAQSHHEVQCGFTPRRKMENVFLDQLVRD